MTTMQRPGRASAPLVRSIAVAAAAVAMMAGLSAMPTLAAARSPLAQARHVPGPSRLAWREPWIRAWLARLDRHGALPGHPRTLPASGLSAPHPPHTTVQVGANPTGVIADPATHTIYVANSSGGSVSVINAATCNAQVTSGCGQVPATIAVGGGPGMALNHKTHTLYVTALDTVSVINAATCNGTNTSGCQALATITVGSGPGILAIDQATDTIYVPNGGTSIPGNTVSVINGATCNATDTSGCGQAPATITVGSAPSAVAVDQASHTVYVGNFNDGTVSVINGATCNAQHTSGCGKAPATVTAGSGITDLAVDPAVGTLYAASTFDGNVSLISTATCNAQHTSGCGQTPPTAPAGSFPIWVSLNPVTGTVYVANQEDSNVSVISAATCNATTRTGCGARPPAMASGFNAGGAAADPSTDTVYATSQNNGTVSVLNGATCNATTTSGCTRYAPATAVGNGPQPVAVNQATHTIYVANSRDNTVSVISAAACNPDHPSGCKRAWPTITVGGGPLYGVAVDQATDTVYVTNNGINTAGTTVSVINGATCNAQITSGCEQTATTITVGNCPAGLAINHATSTLYVANACDSTVSVINTATCNAKVTTGCDQTPPTITVGNGPTPVGVNQATDTIYVGNNNDSTVSVINGATCNARTTSGCGQAPATVTVADSPYGLAVDQHTDTVYVANTGNEFFATGYANLTSSVSVINGAACNGHVTSGCAKPPFAVPVGGFNFDVAVNPATDQVYVDSIVDSDIAVINGTTCNGQATSGCQPRLLPLRTGGWPSYIGLDPADGAMYVTDNVAAAVSAFPLPS
jgi:DNA-binding beta-propeller fold protein YncE